MSLSTMDDATLSRWIAEKLEQRPALDAPDMNWTNVRGFEGPSIFHYGDIVTPGKCWKSDNLGRWQPRDMVNDAQMNMLLIKHPKFVSLNHIDDCDEGSWEATFCKHDEHSIACSQFEVLIADTPEHALVRCFYLANGGTRG